MSDDATPADAADALVAAIRRAVTRLTLADEPAAFPAALEAAAPAAGPVEEGDQGDHAW